MNPMPGAIDAAKRSNTCDWCGQSDGVLITRRAIGTDGAQHVGTVHVVCGPAWERRVKTGKRRGATKATTKWQGQL